jgi:hypothetical protein
MSKIVFDALRTNPEGLDVDQLATIVIDHEGFDPQDQETVSTIRQRCMMAMYRYQIEAGSPRGAGRMEQSSGD